MKRHTTVDEPEVLIDPRAEDLYWRQNYSSRDYVLSGQPYSVYEPAYRYGWESRTRYAGRRWEEIESDLERGWEKFKGQSKLAWHDAKRAARDAWHRLEERLPGDFDRDGR